MIFLYISLGVLAAAAIGAPVAVVVHRKRKRTPHVLVERVAGGCPERAVELSDPSLVSRVMTVMPVIAKAATGANSVLAANDLYRVVIPKGATLAASANGAYRGFYEGAKGIGQAELIKTSVALQGVTAAAELAAVLVRQFYLIRIDKSLTEIKRSVSEIRGFQDDEFRSKVYGLIVEVHTMSATDALNYEKEERMRALIRLDGYEIKCAELLGQANLALTGYAARRTASFPEYERDVQAAQSMFLLRNALYGVMEQIVELKHALKAGSETLAQSRAVLGVYAAQCREAEETLCVWHEEEAEKLGFDLGARTRKRRGMDRVLHFLPGLVRKESKRRKVSEETAAAVEAQMSHRTEAGRSHDLFEEDVEFYVKEGRVFYLPSEEEADA